jgi:hypothetical protein
MVSVLVILLQPLNAEDPMVLTLGGIFSVPKDVLFWNALMPIDNKLPPSATAGIREQFPNADTPIVVMFPAMVSVLDIFELFSNALSPIVLTLTGIFSVPNDVLFRNALAPIDNKLPPSATAGIREQFPNADTPIVVIFPAMVSVLDILLQFSNAEDPMVLTLGGILIVPNDVLLKNAELPITKTFPPRVALVILLHPEKALSPIL